MPQMIEIPVDAQKVTTTPFKSDIIACNNAQRATLIAQASALPSAGQLVLRAALTNDVSISGQVVATVNFPATPTPSRVSSQSVDLPHKYVYVEQITPLTGATIEKISVLLE